MNRREFLMSVGTGALTLFLSGCGLSALADDRNGRNVDAPEKGSVSGGKNMKIVVVNSSPHSDSESTSKYLSGRFIEGAKSSGHEVFVFDAAKEETHPCNGCDRCGMDGPCVWNDAVENKLMPKDTNMFKKLKKKERNI